MKGLILSGGKGTRLRPLTYTRAKQLLPLANKPVLFYAIEALLEAGIREIGLVVGETRKEIEETVGDGSRWSCDSHITYIYQEEPLGLAHAVKIAQPFLGRDRFIMFLGDNLIGESLVPIASEFAAPSYPYHCRVLLAEVSNPSQFGVAELVADPVLVANHRESFSSLCVRRLVEKPAIPPSNLALVGVYFFEHHIFKAVDAIQPSKREELEITDAIQWLIDHDYDVRAQQLHSYWIDTGKMENILDANRQVLLTLTPRIDHATSISSDSMLHGVVIVEAGACIQNSVIRGPAIIGKRSAVRNSYIGPFTSIYHDTYIEASEIEYSIVLEHSRIIGVSGRIEESLIGRYAEVHTSPLKPRGHKFMLGDNSQVGILPS